MGWVHNLSCTHIVDYYADVTKKKKKRNNRSPSHLSNEGTLLHRLTMMSRWEAVKHLTQNRTQKTLNNSL